MKGITERVRKDGTTAYVARPRIAGERIEGATRTFDTWDEAYEYKRRVEGSGAPTKETCDSFAARWLNDYPIVKTGPTRGQRRSPKSEATYREELKPFVRAFRGVPLTDVTRAQARQFAVQYRRSAVVIRNAFNDALDDGLIETNPFVNLNLESRPGRRHHEVLTRDEIHELADTALRVFPEYGPQFQSYVLFTAYVGNRLMEGIGLTWADVSIRDQEVHFRKTKMDNPRTVLLLPEAKDALEALPRTIGGPTAGNHVFRSKRGKPLTKGNHQTLWEQVRAAWWATVSPERRAQIVDLDWHSLRHSCGHYFYVELGFTDEETAYQLGHRDAKLIRTLYGHGKQGALERLKAGAVRRTTSSGSELQSVRSGGVSGG